MLLPIIMILVCVLLGGGTLLFLKFSERRKKTKSRDKEELAQMTANEFVNVKDIRGSFLYTRDGMALAYLKIFPISTELFSKNEKRLIAKQPVQRPISVSAFGCFPPGGYFSPDGGVVLHPHSFLQYQAKGAAKT